MSNQRKNTKTKGSSGRGSQRKQRGQEKKSAPLIKGTILKSIAPTMSNRVKHREFIGDIATDAGFTQSKLEINAGLPTCFPWLSGIAKNFEQYRFHKLKFVYAPVVPATYSGNTYIMPDYDTNDGPPTDVSDVLNTADAVSGPVWCEYVCEIDVKAAGMGLDRMRRKVRDGEVTGDMTSYDYGNLYSGSLGTAVTAPIAGRLFVEYDVELFKPQMSLQHDPVASENTQGTSDFTGVPAGGTQPITFAIPPTNNGRNFTTNAAGEFVAPEKGKYKLNFTSYVEQAPGQFIGGGVNTKVNGTLLPGTIAQFIKDAGAGVQMAQAVGQLMVNLDRGDVLSLEAFSNVDGYNLLNSILNIASS